MNFELGISCRLAPAESSPPFPLSKREGAVRSSAVWECKENFELGANCKLAPAGEPHWLLSFAEPSLKVRCC